MSKKNTAPKGTSKDAASSQPVSTEVRHTAQPKAAPVAKPEAVVAAPAPVAPVAPVAVVAPVVAKAAVVEKAPTAAISARATALIEQLRHPVAETAIEAAEQIADLGAEAGVRGSDALVEVLRNHDGYFNVVTRAAAAMALGRLKNDHAVEPLLAAANDAQAEVSCEAVLALGELKAKSAVQTLQTIVANQGGYYLNVTRHAAIRALGKIGEASSRSTLEYVINAGGEDPALVAAAREALGNL